MSQGHVVGDSKKFVWLNPAFEMLIQAGQRVFPSGDPLVFDGETFPCE